MPTCNARSAFWRRTSSRRRKFVADKLPEFDALRDAARDIKNHTLAHLDLYLEEYESRVVAQGGHVHCAATAADARALVLDICRKLNAATVTKGKSMIAEEVGLNDFLSEHGITPIETDLGEYIIQLRHEMPSHIIAPAVHLSKAQVEADFRRVHTGLPPDRDLTQPEKLLAEARAILREKFLSADVGITGANFLIAETGYVDHRHQRGQRRPHADAAAGAHVLTSIEKMVPTLEDAAQLVRVLARSATGQEMSVYTTLSTGPRRDDDPDGPGEYHVIMLDNGRSAILAGEFQRHAPLHSLRSLHNHCPVYRRGRRSRVWLGLPGTHGGGAHAEPDRHRQSPPSAQRLDILWPVRKSARCGFRCRS